MTWFRDYLYIPLGGNRTGRWRWYFNLFITFALSGLWHGASWGFILWGSLNGLYLIFSNWTQDLRKKGVQWIGLDRLPTFYQGFQVAFTFLLFCFTFILFRAKTLSDALYTMTHFYSGLGSLEGIKMSAKSLYSLGLGRYEFIIVIASLGLMECVETVEKQKNMRQMFSGKPVLVRWAIYYAVVFFLIFFGEYDDHAFIYFQF